ncbi:hypothetical protein [Actinosynnema pretiosum]|uniref:hypothetical protein n=1 Tax=Actinosynnema pretiosum TaxID=42197 RepID=UPI0012FE610F|nr:hypothetical protein [Actinosynnema pretiosum]
MSEAREDAGPIFAEDEAGERAAIGLLSPKEYAAAVVELVTSAAPDVFAVLVEDEEPPDAEIVAWGMAFEGRAEMVSTDGSFRALCRDAESALQSLASSGGLKVRLVWVTPDMVLRKLLAK